MAIGNGYVDVNLNVDTSIRFAYAHGLVDEHLWKRKIVGECCSGNVGQSFIILNSSSEKKIIVYCTSQNMYREV